MAINFARFPGLVLGTIFAVPVIGILVAQWLRYDVDELGKAPRVENGAQRYIESSFQAMCEEARAAARPMHHCERFDEVDLLLYASVIASAVGLGLLLLILLAARVARSNRDTLVRVFRPCLYAILAVLSCLMLLQWGIVTYGAYLLPVALQGKISLIPILAAGAISGGAAIAMIRGALTLIQRPTISQIAVELTRQEQPALHGFVQGIANQIGYHQHITLLAGLQTTFFVTSADVRLINRDRTCTGHTLHLSLPLMRLLTRRELAAIIGHELAHFTGGDIAYSEKFGPMYAGLTGALSAVRKDNGRRDYIEWAAIPAASVLTFLLDRFSLAEGQVRRARELAADKVGAAVTSAQERASGLVKSMAFALVWPSVERYAARLIAQGYALTNMSEAFAATATSDDARQLVRETARANLESATLHPFDEHPPVAARLRALGIDPAAVIDLALQPATHPSSTLIGGLEALEGELSLAEQQLMAETGRVAALLAEEAGAVGTPTVGAASAPA
ncbi:MAG TPA: M48 family metalloprotease [Vineibacter sp.]|nr:M48 family metalloprotease [Vineibacter sp.]